MRLRGAAQGYSAAAPAAAGYQYGKASPAEAAPGLPTQLAAATEAIQQIGKTKKGGLPSTGLRLFISGGITESLSYASALPTSLICLPLPPRTSQTPFASAKLHRTSQTLMLFVS